MNDLDILFSDEFRSSVEANLNRDPVRIALDKRLPHAALVASQVKYLLRAERKLPSYHAARCVLPPLAFEQSSSERTAARKDYSGRLAVDLTCGLGVDSFYLSRRFERVVAVERDPGLAAVARENFRRLGAHNIEVVNSSAGDFLNDFKDRADLIYADPDRRGADGKKLVRIEDCSPDIVALVPHIRRIAPRLVVKLSPLFDVDEVFRVFGRNTCVEVVSLDGECKEVIAEVFFSGLTTPSVVPTAPEVAAEQCSALSARLLAPLGKATPPPREGNPTSTVRAIAIGLGEAEYSHVSLPSVLTDNPDGFSHRWKENSAVSLPSVLTDGWRESTPTRALAQPFEPEKYRHLVIPDVALQKARLARRYFTERGVWIDSDNGYGFAAEEPENIMGRALEIESIEPFDPKSLKRRLKTGGIKNIDILRRNFPLSAADIARQLGVREGGTQKIAFTKAAGRLWQVYLNLSSG